METISKNWKNILLIGMSVVIVMLLRDCNSEHTKITTKDVIHKIPEIVGDLTPTDIKELPSTSTDSIIYKDKIIYSTHPLDKQWAERVKRANDSIGLLKILVESIQIKEQSSDFSNKDLQLKVWTQTRGELKDIKVDYKIPEREVVLKETTIEKIVEKKDNFSFVAGAGINQNIDTKKINYEVSGGIRIKDVSFLASVDANKNIGAKVFINF